MTEARIIVVGLRDSVLAAQITALVGPTRVEIIETWPEELTVTAEMVEPRPSFGKPHFVPLLKAADRAPKPTRREWRNSMKGNR